MNKVKYCCDNIVIGNQVRIGCYSVIGEIGFGFERDEDGFKTPLKRRQHDFGVFLGDGVELGANCVIEQGRWRDTYVGEGTKTASFVHIGHNARIGKDCIICSNTVVGGSANIGDRVFIGLGVMIRDGITIGSDVTIAMGSIVVKDVPNGATVMGNPAKQKNIIHSIKIKKRIEQVNNFPRIMSKVDHIIEQRAIKLP